MTLPRQLAALCLAATLGSTALPSSAAASSVGVTRCLRQKTGSAATVPKKRNPAATPPRRRVVTKPKPAPAPSYSRTEDPAALAQHLAAALNGRTRSGLWGAMVISLTQGDTLFSQNADGPMLPASTMKMYTSAIALDRFGPDYVFKTPVLRDAPIA